MCCIVLVVCCIVWFVCCTVWVISLSLLCCVTVATDMRVYWYVVLYRLCIASMSPQICWSIDLYVILYRSCITSLLSQICRSIDLYGFCILQVVYYVIAYTDMPVY